MLNFSIWVDADSCPIPVKDIIFRFCKRLQIKLIFVANHEIPMPKSQLFQMIVCDATPDAADNYIVDNAMQNDNQGIRDVKTEILNYYDELYKTKETMNLDFSTYEVEIIED